MLDSKGSRNQPLHERLLQLCAPRAAVVYTRDIQTCGVTSKSCVPKGGSTTEKPVSCMVSRLCS
jgi:hypothetical protein